MAARVGPYPYVDLEDLLAASDPLVVVLDGVTDPHSLGAVLRVAGRGRAASIIPKGQGRGRHGRRNQGERGR